MITHTKIYQTLRNLANAIFKGQPTIFPKANIRVCNTIINDITDFSDVRKNVTILMKQVSVASQKL